MRTQLSSRKAAPALALLALWVASLACAAGGGETPAPASGHAGACRTVLERGGLNR